MDGERPSADPGGPIVTAGRVRVSGEGVRIGAPLPEGAAGEPRVQLVREGGEVRAIDVTCKCGERIRIRCDYN